MPVALTGSSALTIDLWTDANQTWSGSRPRSNHARGSWHWTDPYLTTDQVSLMIDVETNAYTAAGPQYIIGRWADANATANRWTDPMGTRGWVQAYTGTAQTHIVTLTGETLWDGTAGTLWQDGIQQSPEMAEQYRRRHEKDKLQRARASKRGRKLLLSLLSEEQQRQYAATQCFTVLAEDGLIYRLRKRRTAELVGPDGGSVANYCIHLSGAYCPEDNLIAQKFLLETSVPEFERIANITVIRDRLYKQIKASAGKPQLLRAA